MSLNCYAVRAPEADDYYLLAYGNVCAARGQRSVINCAVRGIFFLSVGLSSSSLVGDLVGFISNRMAIWRFGPPSHHVQGRLTPRESGERGINHRNTSRDT